jgi:DNA-binding NarL/FixJ family response regulator
MSESFRKSLLTPTRREQELIVLIARGLQNKVIAYKLNISENTVRAHISNIMRKYRLRNRTQIAVMFTTQPATSEEKRTQSEEYRAFEESWPPLL